MKLKKILASLTAAALAVTAVPVVVSAEATWITSLPYQTAGDDTLWYDKVYDVSAEDISVTDASKANIYFTYTSTDSGKWGSQYEVKQKDDNWPSITGCVNLQIATESTPAIFPYDEAKMADGFYFTGFNVIVPEIGVTYYLGETAVNGEFATWDAPPKKINVSDIPDDVKYIGLTYSTVDTNKWGSQYQIGIDGTDPYEFVKGCTNLNKAADATTIYLPASILDGLAEDAVLNIQGWNIAISKLTYYGDLDPSVPATSITLDPTSLSFKLGDETETINATVEPANTTDTVEWSTVEWSIDDDAVASIEASPDGLSCKVTPKAAGTATITAKTNAGVSATCAVTVEENTYAISVNSNDDTYGTASADKTEAAEGETVKISAEAADGYQFDNWVVISGGVKLADEESENTSFKMPAAEVEIKAVFSEIPENSYGITVKSAEGGSAKASEKSAVAGTKITLTATPDNGYEFDKWIVSPETVVIENDTFTMPEAAVTITPVFKKSTYTVEVEVIGGGTASADKTTAVMGETVTITAVPDDGYYFPDQIKVNGKYVKGTSFTMPAKNVKVVVEFEKIIEINISIFKPEEVSVDVDFVSSKEDIFAAALGNDYENLYKGHTLSVVMSMAGESAVPAKDKELIKEALFPGQEVGLYLDLSLYKKIDDNTETVRETISPISLSIGVPDSIIADGRTYSVMRVHDGKAENIGGDFDSETKTITVSSALFSTYAIVYEGKAAAEPVTKPEPVKYYTITTDKNVTASASTAAAGTVIDVKADFGYDAYVYCGTRMLMKITDRGSFVMPAGNVRIVSQENGYLSMVRNAAPNSYIFVYDADMNYIKTNGSVKGIVGKGKVTVKLGEEYAGRTVTLYKGRKSTKVEVASMVLDENGNATFTVDGGKNYTAVVE